MASVYLIRHGQASAHQNNYDQLSDLGIAQSALLGEELLKRYPNLPSFSRDAFTRGTLYRHQQTAEIALAKAQCAECAVASNDAWNEYDHQAILAAYNEQLRTPSGTREFMKANNLPKTAFKQLFITAIEQWITAQDSLDYPETWQAFTQRVMTGFEHAVNRAKNGCGTQFIFTSGGPISLIATHLLGLPLTQFMHINWSLVNASMTKVLINSKTDTVTLSTLNDYSMFERYASQSEAQTANNPLPITYT